MALLQAIATWAAQTIVLPIVREQVEELKKWIREELDSLAIERAIYQEGLEIVQEWGNAETDEERKAILRKFNNFSPF